MAEANRAFRAAVSGVSAGAAVACVAVMVVLPRRLLLATVKTRNACGSSRRWTRVNIPRVPAVNDDNGLGRRGRLRQGILSCPVPTPRITGHAVSHPPRDRPRGHR